MKPTERMEDSYPDSLTETEPWFQCLSGPATLHVLVTHPSIPKAHRGWLLVTCHQRSPNQYSHPTQQMPASFPQKQMTSRGSSCLQHMEPNASPEACVPVLCCSFPGARLERHRTIEGRQGEERKGDSLPALKLLGNTQGMSL